MTRFADLTPDELAADSEQIVRAECAAQGLDPDAPNPARDAQVERLLATVAFDEALAEAS